MVVLPVALLTVKLTSELEAQLQGRASQEELSKSEVVRRALWAYLTQQPCSAPIQRQSALDQVADLVGICTGAPADLASNPDHLAGFGEL
jgi:hypothetical protein